MTISPPANVKVEVEEGRVLSSGFDTLVLSIDVQWESDALFLKLGELKELAKGAEMQTPGVLQAAGGADPWIFNLAPHGAQGYEWLLVGRGFTLKIGNWMTPKSRPSVMAELRSEALWHQGPRATADAVRSLLENQGGQVLSVKASRADLCVDVLLPAAAWSVHVKDHLVTRAVNVASFDWHRKLTGLGIGSGMISARLYDKPLEIATQSHKVWMFDVWRLPSVPLGRRVIRVEFQLRREAIKDLGIDTLAELLAQGGNVWAYCTQEWLKLQDDPGKHHTQQQTLPWWGVVQNGFAGAQ